eukprot:tig00000443_g777.t1
MAPEPEHSAASRRCRDWPPRLPQLEPTQSRATRIADSISGATFQRWTQARPPNPSHLPLAARSLGRRQLRGEPLDSKPRTFPARPDVVRANVARAAASMRRLRSREKARRQVTRITRQPPARAGSR